MDGMDAQEQLNSKREEDWQEVRTLPSRNDEVVPLRKRSEVR